MAGYLFSLALDKKGDPVLPYFDSGIYSTKFKDFPKDGRWAPAHESTFGDYATMKDGDYAFFFAQRKIYGIARLKNIGDINPDCKFLNYPGSNDPGINPEQFNKYDVLANQKEPSIHQRWVCTFEPYPAFFEHGIDMDDLLSSNPSAFKALRVFEKRSFIKLDDEETQAFIDAILRHEHMIDSKPIPSTRYISEHKQLEKKLSKGDYKFTPATLIEHCVDVSGKRLTHEMAVEGALLHQLAGGDQNAIQVFGHWDFIAHQVNASPQKPVQYIDKIDIFGSSYIQTDITYPRATIGKYLVLEIKADKAKATDIDQVLKYVDWVKDQYCHGDYNMVDAFLVASSFTKNITAQLEKSSALRSFTVNRRPARSTSWNNLKLVTYTYDPVNKGLTFEVIYDANAKASPSKNDLNSLKTQDH